MIWSNLEHLEVMCGNLDRSLPLWNDLRPSEQSGIIRKDVEQSGAILERSGAIWNQMGRSGAIWTMLKDLGRSGLIWSNLERTGTIWNDLEPFELTRAHFHFT